MLVSGNAGENVFKESATEKALYKSQDVVSTKLSMEQHEMPVSYKFEEKCPAIRTVASKFEEKNASDTAPSTLFNATNFFSRIRGLLYNFKFTTRLRALNFQLCRSP